MFPFLLLFEHFSAPLSITLVHFNILSQKYIENFEKISAVRNHNNFQVIHDVTRSQRLKTTHKQFLTGCLPIVDSICLK